MSTSCDSNAGCTPARRPSSKSEESISAATDLISTSYGFSRRWKKMPLMPFFPCQGKLVVIIELDGFELAERPPGPSHRRFGEVKMSLAAGGHHPAEGQREKRQHRCRRGEPQDDGRRLLRVHEIAHQEHGDGRNRGSDQRGHHAKHLLVVEALIGIEQRQFGPGDDQHAGKTDGDRAPAVDADRLAEEDRGKYDDQQRLGVVQRDRLRQRQPGQREEAEPHGADADQAARDVVERPPGREGSGELALEGEEGDDREDGEEGPEEDDLPGRHVAGRLDAGLHADENRHRDDLQRDVAQRVVADGMIDGHLAS